MLTATEPRAAARGRRPRSALMACCAAAALLPLAAAGCAQQRVQVAPVVAVDGERLPAAEAAATAADPYERGKAHLRDGRPGLALQAFRAALAARPDAVMALNGIGVAYDQLGRFDLAERYYHRALALNPDAAETHNNLGYSALRQGKATLARRHFARAHELSPGDAVVVANLDLAGGAEPAAGRRSVPPRTLVAAAPATWVERTSATTQTIVTRPDPELSALATAYGVHPAVFSLVDPPAAYGYGRRAEPAAPAAPPPRRPPAGDAAGLRPVDGLAAAPAALQPVDGLAAAAAALRLFDEYAAAPAALRLFDAFAAAPAALRLFDELAATAG